MLPFNNKSKIILFHEPVNLHKGFDALAHIAQTEMSLTFAPNLFVIFSNRKRNRIKIMYHDGQNLLLMAMRFEKTLNFKYKKGIIFNKDSFNRFINTTISRQR